MYYVQGPVNKAVRVPLTDMSLTIFLWLYCSSVHWPTASCQGLHLFTGGLPLQLQKAVLFVGLAGCKGQEMNTPFGESW